MSAATSLTGSPPSLSSHISPSPPRDPLASGLRNLFDPTIRQTTEKLWTVNQSQIALSEELDRLISQLTHYLDTTDPPALKPTIIKLASVSKRLTAVNTQLHQIQARVNRLFIQLSQQKPRTTAPAPTSPTPGPSAATARISSSPAAAALAAAVAGSPSGSRGNS
ncbi:hypothetical protein H072_3513 [Dactylellina haptotyla CBS 200.50]|uniref:Biogenesis of lysosome-related organelles complex 1 subunit 7 n=1 Tax=Dactylellina haptotyla (strain CBS 200.50) TaxID=1284197 RepID=S8C491_DACHA|nr:hypothetical protein H072_3513 [Dactylellina haptotyla CBS 200.50]